MNPQIVRVPHPSVKVDCVRLGPQDLDPILDRLDVLLAGDYFFRRKHMEGILTRGTSATWGIHVAGEFSGLIIIYRGSLIHNLYLDPTCRGLGVGAAVLAHFNVTQVRAKGNMTDGDPIPFYEQNGYKAVGAEPGKPHIVIMEKAAEPPTEAAAKRQAQLKRMRDRSAIKRAIAKWDDDYQRLKRCNLLEEQIMLAMGPRPVMPDDGTPSQAATTGVAPPSPPPAVPNLAEAGKQTTPPEVVPVNPTSPLVVQPAQPVGPDSTEKEIDDWRFSE